MATLHMIHSPINNQAFASKLTRFYSVGDTILFLNDASFSLTELSQINAATNLLSDLNKLMVIKEQVIARGLEKLINFEKVEAIDYQRMVKLTLQAEKTISW